MNWQIAASLSKKSASREEAIIKLLFKNRGLKTKKQQADFISPPDPFSLPLSYFGLTQKSADKVTQRIARAIHNQEETLVYGDYDADGVCATAILWEVLTKAGLPVLPYLPDRFREGYGLNKETIRRLKQENPDLRLIITVDQGITAKDQVDYAQGIGLDVIITDHHLLPAELPPAVGIFHTTGVSGSGVAWLLAREIAALFPAKISPQCLRELLGLAAIGNLTDLMSLLGPSRSLTTFGLRALQKTNRPGIKAIFKKAGADQTSLGTYEIGFVIGPRLNAAGRLSHAIDALRLLCTRDPKRANLLAEQLENTNQRRQEVTKNVIAKARSQWQLKKIKGAKIIVLDGPDWEQGVLGLAASRLADELYLPVIIISRGPHQSRASARSIDGFDITASLREVDNLLIDVGGHPLAAGFTIFTKNIPEFKEKIIALAEQNLESRFLEKNLKLDCSLTLNDLSRSLFQKIQKLAPFGIDNPEPDFAFPRLSLLSARLVGQEKKHLKIEVGDACSKKVFTGIGFGLGHLFPTLRPHQSIDLAASLITNVWRDRETLELKIKDLKSSSAET